MSILESAKTYATAEAKLVGSEVVTPTHLFVGLINLLTKRDVITDDHPLNKTAEALHEQELLKGLAGFKTPEFSEESLKMISEIATLEDLKKVAETYLEKIKNFDFEKTKKVTEQSTNIPKQQTAIGGFHEVNGSRTGRLPTFVFNREAAANLILGYLMRGEEYVWDGVYNTKDNQLSTRFGSQSMGRVFVTNYRLIFWSDDEDKPHVGVLYSDIQFWKTSWMPLKSRGVVMQVGGRKVLFAANSTTMEHATNYINAHK